MHVGQYIRSMGIQEDLQRDVPHIIYEFHGVVYAVPDPNRDRNQVKVLDYESLFVLAGDDGHLPDVETQEDLEQQFQYRLRLIYSPWDDRHPDTCWLRGHQVPVLGATDRDTGQDCWSGRVVLKLLHDNEYR